MPRREIDEEQLLEAALEEFTLRSFEEASVNRIIKNAGISKGSFYYRFENKYQLYIFLLREANRIKWEFIYSETQSVAETEADIFRLFELQAESGLRFAAAHPAYHRLSGMFLKEKGSTAYRKALEDLGATDTANIRELVSRSYKAGLFKERFSLDFVTRILNTLFASYDDLLFRDTERNLEQELDSLKDFMELLQHGLKR